MVRTRAQAVEGESKRKASAPVSTSATRNGSVTLAKGPTTPAKTNTDKPSDRLENDIRSNLYRLVSRTQPSSTICPSQVARAMHADDTKIYPDWRELMDPVREVVWRDVKVGKVQVTQKGEVRDWEGREEIRGPIRVRRGPGWDHVQAEVGNRKEGRGG